MLRLHQTASPAPKAAAPFSPVTKATVFERQGIGRRQAEGLCRFGQHIGWHQPGHLQRRRG